MIKYISTIQDFTLIGYKVKCEKCNTLHRIYDLFEESDICCPVCFSLLGTCKTVENVFNFSPSTNCKLFINEIEFLNHFLNNNTWIEGIIYFSNGKCIPVDKDVDKEIYNLFQSALYRGITSAASYISFREDGRIKENLHAVHRDRIKIVNSNPTVFEFFNNNSINAICVKCHRLVDNLRSNEGIQTQIHYDCKLFLDILSIFIPIDKKYPYAMDILAKTITKV